MENGKKVTHVYIDEAARIFEPDGEPTRNFQTCAGLDIIDEYAKIMENGLEPLSVLVGLQETIQNEVFGFDFADMRASYKKTMKYMNWNYSASQDEFREFYTSLGGMSGFGMAFWKPWKTDHSKCMASSFEKLSGDDKLEAQYEIIDLMHFMFNMALCLGISPIDMKFFFWNIDGEYSRTMEGTESLAMMLKELLDSPETIGKYNAIRYSNERLIDFVDYKHKVWQGRMITLFECISKRDFGWYLGEQTSDKKQNTSDSNRWHKADVVGNWIEAFKAILHIAAILAMDEKTITNLYFAKNIANRERQQRPGGY
jgi:hypothetical protein